MNTVLLTFLAILAIASATYLSQQNSNESGVIEEDGKSEISGRSIIVNHEWKKIVHNFLKQFENGYRKDEIVLNRNISFAELNAKIENFCIMGFDNIVIKRLNVDFTLVNKVSFKFVFPKIVISGKLPPGSFIDALNELGLKLTSNNEGDFEVTLENTIFEGKYRYKMPNLFGSLKIYNFNGSIKLGNVVSRIDGLLANEKLNQLMNEHVEDIILKQVNSNQAKINSLLNDYAVPFVNSKLEKLNIWTVVG